MVLQVLICQLHSRVGCIHALKFRLLLCGRIVQQTLAPGRALICDLESIALINQVRALDVENFRVFITFVGVEVGVEVAVLGIFAVIMLLINLIYANILVI